MLKELFQINKLAFAPFINMNYPEKSKHNIYDKNKNDLPYVENVVETVERFNKNTGISAKNNVNYDESSNIPTKHQDYSFDSGKVNIMSNSENYNFDKEITIRKNIFASNEKMKTNSINTYFNNDKKEENIKKNYNNDVLQEISDDLEFLSRRAVYIK